MSQDLKQLHVKWNIWISRLGNRKSLQFACKKFPHPYGDKNFCPSLLWAWKSLLKEDGLSSLKFNIISRSLIISLLCYCLSCWLIFLPVLSLCSLRFLSRISCSFHKTKENVLFSYFPFSNLTACNVGDRNWKQSSSTSILHLSVCRDADRRCWVLLGIWCFWSTCCKYTKI